MPEPQKSHLRIAHDIGEQLMVCRFTETQRRILDLVLRLSWGCGKEFAVIPYQKDFEAVGIREGHVKLHLDWLTKARILFREDSLYSLNRNFNDWQVNRTLTYSPERLTELVSLNLKKSYAGRKSNLTQGVIKSYAGRKPVEAKVEAAINSDINIYKEIVSKDTTKKSDKNRYGDYCFLTEKQYRDLITKFGLAEAEHRIDEFNNYIGSRALFNKYKDHYRTILSWYNRELREKGASNAEGKVPKHYKTAEEHYGEGWKRLETDDRHAPSPSGVR